MGWERGKLQKEGRRGDRAEEHQEVVGKGKEVQTRGVKNPPGEIESESQTAIMD